MNHKNYNWGIIGCGGIANKFAPDLVLNASASIAAVASRSLEKAHAFADKHGVKKAYGSYQELFNDPTIDIVYIATPHVSHAALSIEALKHGKHVLCEKPLAINAKETEEIIATAKKQKRFFMEALWTRFNPTFLKVKSLIDDNHIGAIQNINADFAFKSNHPIEGRLFNINLGGGALLDIGIYPVFLSYALLGKPKNIIATSKFHEQTGCDIQTSIILQYDNAQAILYCGLTSNSDMTARISATNGNIHIEDRWHQSDHYTVIKEHENCTYHLPKTGGGYFHEIEECHKCLDNNQIESKLWSHQNSLELITLLDEIREQIGLKYQQD